VESPTATPARELVDVPEPELVDASEPELVDASERDNVPGTSMWTSETFAPWMSTKLPSSSRRWTPW
jgi:hypothetical protein